MNSDKSSIGTWNESYNIVSPTLWGEPSVPYASEWKKYLCIPGPILDMPCGDGRNTLTVGCHGRALVGADSSSRALKIARCRLDSSAEGANSVLLEQDAFNTNFSDNSFAAVFCWDLLGHLSEPRKVIEELIRIVRPGGIVIGSVFSLGDSTKGYNMQRIRGEEYLFDNRFYFRFYGKEDATELVNGYRADCITLELTSWSEPPHEGYRPYDHQHESWAFILRKSGNVS